MIIWIIQNRDIYIKRQKKTEDRRKTEKDRQNTEERQNKKKVR